MKEEIKETNKKEGKKERTLKAESKMLINEQIVSLELEVTKKYEEGELKNILVNRVILVTPERKLTHKPVSYVRGEDKVTGFTLSEKKKGVWFNELNEKFKEINNLLKKGKKVYVETSVSPFTAVDEEGEEETYYTLNLRDIQELEIIAK